MSSHENIPFQGNLQKIRLIANNMGYGPLPAPGEEVEQRLTMTREGKVWLSRYSFYDTMRNRLMSCKQFSVDSRCVESLFKQISAHFTENELMGMATDVPMWDLELFNTTGEVFRYTGPMLRTFQPFLDVISDKLRALLEKEHLFAFDGEPGNTD